MEAEKTQKLHREDNSRFNSFKTMTSNSGTVMCVLSLLLSVGVLIRVETIDSRLETVESVLTKDSQNPVSRPLHQKKVLVEIQSSPPQGTDEKLKELNKQTRHQEEANSRARRSSSSTRNLPSVQQLRQEIDLKIKSITAVSLCQPLYKVCVPGPRGPPGPRGARGRRGKRGFRGSRGRTGARGPQGEIGKQGKQGMMGSAGMKGEKGEKGDPGPRGPRGMRGEPGESISAPKVIVSPASLTVTENQTATLHCSATGNPEARVVWTAPRGSSVVERMRIGSGGELQIINATFNDTGLYRCSARNILGTDNRTVPLQVEAPPMFSSKPDPIIKARVGSVVTITCKAFGNPQPAIQWSRPFFSMPDGRFEIQNGTLTINSFKKEDSGVYICKATNKLGSIQSIVTFNYVEGITRQARSCQDLVTGKSLTKSGATNLLTYGLQFKAYCDVANNIQGWTLIARFSNNDIKNWMRNDGHWWYDQRSSQGGPTNPAANTDMISPAFWLVTGTEFKITRSDDLTHTALLVTTGGCLGGQTFRSKLTSYGNFRDSVVWASDKCLGSCNVQYGGRYQSTHGFEQAACDGGIQSRNKIGFWCDWDAGDGSVMMIGGGGSGCSRADHGIGITEVDAASFENTGSDEYDFGYDNQGPSLYSLNLWVR